MSDADRPKKKKKKQGKKKQPSSAHGPLIGTGVAFGVGFLLLIIGAVVSGAAQIILLVLGIVALIVAGVFGYSLVAASLFPPSKLVFREDAVELVQGKGKAGVVGRLPFANVATVEMATVEVQSGITGRRYRVRGLGPYAGTYNPADVECGSIESALLVMLYKKKDRDTWWPNNMDSEARYDIVILNDYNVPLGVIQRRILDGVAQHVADKAQEDRNLELEM